MSISIEPKVLSKHDQQQKRETIVQQYIHTFYK